MNNCVPILAEQQEFIFHFDVSKEEISLESFIEISNALERTCSSVANLLFDAKDCKIVLKPIEKGSLKLFYTIVVAGILCPMVPDTINGILQEYTGHDWGYYAGKSMRAITDTVTELFKADTVRLKKTERSLPDERKSDFDKIIKAQSDFYRVLDKDNNIRALGFTEESVYPIQRKDFSLHISDDIERDKPAEIALKNLVIYRSLNVNEDGKWEFRDKADGKHFSATIEDENFKNKFLSGKTPLKKSKQDDEIKALVQYDKKIKNGNTTNPTISIKTVYYFNNKILLPIPQNLVDDLIVPKPKDDAQGELFQ